MVRRWIRTLENSKLARNNTVETDHFNHHGFNGIFTWPATWCQFNFDHFQLPFMGSATSTLSTANCRSGCEILAYGTYSSGFR